MGSLMAQIGALIQASYPLGALSTGELHFYERLGWTLWRGPTGVDAPGGRQRRRSHASSTRSAPIGSHASAAA